MGLTGTSPCCRGRAAMHWNDAPARRSSSAANLALPAPRRLDHGPRRESARAPRTGAPPLVASGTAQRGSGTRPAPADRRRRPTRRARHPRPRTPARPAAVRHPALKTRVHADGLRKGYLATHVILRNCTWAGPFDAVRDAAARRWWTRWVRHLDREWVEDAELGSVAATWIGMALDEGELCAREPLASHRRRPEAGGARLLRAGRAAGRCLRPLRIG